MHQDAASNMQNDAIPIDRSRVETEILAFPADANTAGQVYGGRILHWVDMAASLVARKHCRCPVATMRVEFDFLQPVNVGDHLRFVAFITRTFNTSFEVQVDLRAAGTYGAEQEGLAGRGYLVFSCLGPDGKPLAVLPVEPRTTEEQRRWRQAEERRRLRSQLRTLER